MVEYGRVYSWLWTCEFLLADDMKEPDLVADGSFQKHKDNSNHQVIKCVQWDWFLLYMNLKLTSIMTFFYRDQQKLFSYNNHQVSPKLKKDKICKLHIFNS